MKVVRNNAIYKHMCRLVELGYTADEIHEISSFINKYFFMPPLEHREFMATFNSALQRAPSGKNYNDPPAAPTNPSCRTTRKTGNSILRKWVTLKDWFIEMVKT